MNTVHELSPEEAQDRRLLDAAGMMSCGASAFHALSPDAEAMAREEAADSAEVAAEALWSARVSALVVALDFLFGAGPHPAAVCVRVRALAENFRGTMRVTGRATWWKEDAVVEVLKRRRDKIPGALPAEAGGLGTWWAEIAARGEEEAEVASVVMERVVDFLAAEGRVWRTMTAAAYGLAKALRPDLLGGMSLADLAVLSGDRGRATPQARIKRQITDLMADFFGRPQRVHFQKGLGASRACAAAQVGNRNRKKAARRKLRRK